jgi:hypothetical protein
MVGGTGSIASPDFAQAHARLIPIRKLNACRLKSILDNA